MRHDDQHREKMFSLIAAWQNSGLSQRAYCEQHSVRYSLFHYWYSRFRQQQTTPEQATRFLPINVQLSAATTAAVEVVLADGKRLLFHHGVAADYLKAIIS
jgi:hypothetical protein